MKHEQEDHVVDEITELLRDHSVAPALNLTIRHSAAEDNQGEIKKLRVRTNNATSGPTSAPE